MKNPFALKTTSFCVLLLSFTTAFSQNNFFRNAEENTVKTAAKRVIIPEKYRVTQLDTTSIKSFFSILPSEAKLINRNTAPLIAIPMPDGNTASFRIWESAAMAPELAAAFPGIKTFTGQGVDDPTATIKIDWTEFGFHAMILSPVTGAVFIDPYDQKTITNYISYFKKDLKRKGTYFEGQPKRMPVAAKPDNVLAGVCTGTQLRTYRLAIACTHEYAIAATGLSNPTKAQTLAKIVTTVNRVNGVYEKELSIRIVLVATENNVIFNSKAVDPFTPNTAIAPNPSNAANDNATILIDESQQKIDSAIGNANYDIGHTFSTGGGGLAGLGVVCTTGSKASGITGSTSPVGDPYDIDYVAHEMGHEFGADHTFNSALGFCAGNDAPGFNAEPGSGSTIMAYAGICDADNLQPNSDPQFHGISFDEITNYTINSTGNGCAVKTATGNAAPVVNAGAAYVIPISTPFLLTGSATDANNDALTYSWEQVDVSGPVGTWNSPSGDAPLFRSFPPTTTPVRYFPKLSSQIKNLDSIGELKPTYARTMHFRLTARDNKAGGGGVCNAQTSVTTSAAAGPFIVTAPNTSGLIWYVNDFKTVTWNIAGTNTAPINSANVNIELSTDGGLTFPVMLASNTPNDGTEEIQVPNNVSSAVRIRVMAVGNIFYDFSNFNLSIQASPSSTFVFNSPAVVAVCSASSGSTTIKTGALGGFATTINLAASLNPAGTTVTLGATSLAPGASTTVTLNNANSATPGTYTVRITGTAGAVVKTRDIQFTIGGGPGAPASLTSPANDSVGVKTKPTFNWSAVAGATGYNLQISKFSDFSVIAQTVSNINPPYTLAAALGEDTIYYWRVSTLGGCGIGVPGAVPNRFRTGLTVCPASNTFTSTNVPKVISSGPPTRITSTLTVPAGSGIILGDVDVVGLIGTHSYINDLTMVLIGPAGDSVILFASICGQDADFNLNLNDQAAITTFPCPPIGGVTVTPTESLSIFNGKNSAGVWTLAITDGFDGDGGSLTGWGIKTTAPCNFTATPLATTYTFTGTGNWSTASNWTNSQIPPATLPSGATITINHTKGGQCLLNVPQHIAAGASLIVLTGKNLVVQGALNIQ